MGSWRSFLKSTTRGARPAVMLCAAVVLCTAIYVGMRDVPDIAATPVMQISASTDSAPQDVLTAFRTERESSRIRQLAALDKLIESQPVDEETVKLAAQQKLDLLDSIEKETTLEGALALMGFEEPTCTVHSESVNVFLRVNDLAENQLAQILTMCCEETGADPKNIKVIPIT